MVETPSEQQNTILRIVEKFHLPKSLFLNGIATTLDQIKCKHSCNLAQRFRGDRGVETLVLWITALSFVMAFLSCPV